MPLTRQQELEQALIALAAQGRCLVSFARANMLTPEVLASSEALFDAAAALAVPVVDEPAPETVVSCQHPIEQRVDFGTTNGYPDWECRVCGYRSPTTLDVKG